MSLTTVDVAPTVTAFTVVNTDDDGNVMLSVTTETTVGGYPLEVPVYFPLSMDADFHIGDAAVQTHIAEVYNALGYAMP